MKKILIVGVGLAGISLTERLLEKNADVTVIADLDSPSSTKVATGMFNPIVFRRLNKTWMIDEVLPSMHSFYEAIEAKIKTQIKSEVRLFKRIPSKDYKEFWNKRAIEFEFQDYINPIKNNLGEVNKAGWVDCPMLCDQYQNFLRHNGFLLNEKFEFELLLTDKNGVSYRGEQFHAVVFCEGPYAVNNPYFKWLPFKVAKGDWIVIETVNDLKLDGVINNVVNIIPLGNQQYKLSSTFEWETDSWTPNKKASKELLDAFEEMFETNYKVLDHQSGLRPSASDRRPYLGAHPRHPNVHIFNGLGSKGVILAPYFSKHLAEHILDNKALMPEVNIHRHIKRFREFARLSEISS